MEPIISRDMIAAKARAAFAQGAGRDDHGFNWHSTAAIDVWQAEWDVCLAEQQQDRDWAAQQLAEACPP